MTNINRKQLRLRNCLKMLSGNGKRSNKDFQGKGIIFADYTLLKWNSLSKKNLHQKRPVRYDVLIDGKFHEMLAGSFFGVVGWGFSGLGKKKMPQIAKYCRTVLKIIAL